MKSSIKLSRLSFSQIYQGVEVLPSLIKNIDSDTLQDSQDSMATAFTEKFTRPLKELAVDLSKDFFNSSF